MGRDSFVAADSPSAALRHARSVSRSAAAGGDFFGASEAFGRADDHKAQLVGIKNAVRDALGIIERDRSDQRITPLEIVDPKLVALHGDERRGDAARRVE